LAQQYLKHLQSLHQKNSKLTLKFLRLRHDFQSDNDV
jgi:hypothetical protein